MNILLLWLEDRIKIFYPPIAAASVSSELLERLAIFANGYGFLDLMGECLSALTDRVRLESSIQDIISCLKLAMKLRSPKDIKECLIELRNRPGMLGDFFAKQLPADAQALMTLLKVKIHADLPL